MTTYTEIEDIIIGDRIIVEARKISDGTVIVKTGKHKAQRIKLNEEAICIVDKKLHFIKD